ncbi:MAG: hypothetical protein ACWA40_10980, partial [Planktomarina sp.]
MSPLVARVVRSVVLFSGFAVTFAFCAAYLATFAASFGMTVDITVGLAFVAAAFVAFASARIHTLTRAVVFTFVWGCTRLATSIRLIYED